MPKAIKTVLPKPTFIEYLRGNFSSLIFSFIFFLALAYFVKTVASDYNWQFDRVFHFLITPDGKFGILITSLQVTISLVCISLLLALFLGIFLAAMKLSSSPIARLCANGFIGIIRNTPLLMQLYLIYFVFAPLFSLTPFFAAALALAFFEGAYMAEIFRAGFVSIPHTQWEAGFSLGFNVFEVGKIVILPQAVHNVLPSLMGQIVSLIKDTSLVSAIAVTDLTMRASEIIAETYISFEIWLIVTLIYLILTSSVSLPTALYAKYVKRKRKGF